MNSLVCSNEALLHRGASSSSSSSSCSVGRSSSPTVLNRRAAPFTQLCHRDPFHDTGSSPLSDGCSFLWKLV